MKKAVVITGAGTGIGAASALEFSNNGYFVFLLGRRPETLNQTATQCKDAKVISCDVSNPESVKKAAREILTIKDVVIQTLVNNAGIFIRESQEQDSDETWLNQFNTNLFGAVRLTREFFPYFKQKQNGYIVNVSSTLGLTPTSETIAYSASKAAMNNWTQGLALAGGPFNIRCNCVCPGLVDTPIHSFHSLAEADKKKTLDSLKGIQPLGRIGTPEEIAKAVYFLGSENSSWTTGAVLSVDGGINLI